MNSDPADRQPQTKNSVDELLNSVDIVATERVRSHIMSVSGTLIVWMPVFILIVFAIHGTVSGAPLPLYIYPIILRVLWIPSAVGGLMLFFSALRAKLHFWTIGVLSLSIAVFALSGALISGKQAFDLDPANLVQAGDIVLAVSSALTVLCMLALNFLSVHLVMRVFRRNDAPPEKK
jgi:hypothetical protein